MPVLTPRLSSYWVHLITPIPANIAQPLIKGLTNEVVVHDDTSHRLFPNIQLLDYETSVRLAFEKIKNRGGETSWTDALTSSHRGKAPVALLTKEGMIIERRQRTVAAPVEAVYRAFARLGGETGWLYLNWTWKIRRTRRSALWRSRDETRTARCRGRDFQRAHSSAGKPCSQIRGKLHFRTHSRTADSDLTRWLSPCLQRGGKESGRHSAQQEMKWESQGLRD